MSIVAVEAKPLSRRQIRDFAAQMRDLLGFAQQSCIDVERLIDIVLPKMLSGFHYDVRTMSEMGEKHGEADPADVRISLREDVHKGMVQGKGRDRFTTVHEIAHLLFHTPDRIVLNRRGGIPPAYCDPEWQANCFAGEFLGGHMMAAQCQNVHQFAQAANLSLPAARVQWGAYTKEGLIPTQK